MSNGAQLTIDSDFARDRAHELAQRTGRTVTEIVEEALREYEPERPETAPAPYRLVRKGRLLVIAGGPTVTLEEANAAIEEDRNRPLFR